MGHRIGRWWRKLRPGHNTSWPLIEQGEYRTYRAVHPFDERFGVDTSGLLYDLPSGHAHDAHNHGYFAVAPSVFNAVLQAMAQRLHLDFSHFNFIDIGSGKGRALLLASHYPFHTIIGVELSPELDRVARANVSRYPGAAEVTCIQGDATAFVFPPGPIVLYMWNAFTRPVMEQVFRNLEASLAAEPRTVYLIYMHPELESTLISFPWLTPIWREEFMMSEEDYAAWAFPTRAELCAVYGAFLPVTKV